MGRSESKSQPRRLELEGNVGVLDAQTVGVDLGQELLLTEVSFECRRHLLPLVV